ncbi:hypothetical protein DFP72DRAFT_775337, partial [Ephemerocybe angulata]
MLSVASKYNLRYAPPLLTEEGQRSLPAWYHPGKRGTTNTRDNGTIPQCLRDVHGVFTVGQLEALVSDFPHPPEFHEPPQEEVDTLEPGCQCTQCDLLRQKGCKDPVVCLERAVHELSLLGEKWHPNADAPTINDLVHRFKEVTATLVLSETEKVFDPVLSAYASREGGFRIF